MELWADAVFYKLFLLPLAHVKEEEKKPVQKNKKSSVQEKKPGTQEKKPASKEKKL
jgi:hypothetical protein